MSKNIEMQEKTSSSTYETLYPKTSASQVFLSEEAKQATNGLENLDQAASFWGGGQFEIGDVKISARNNLGSKWLECNGNVISKTDYPQLSNYCEEKGWPFGTEQIENISGSFPCTQGLFQSMGTMSAEIKKLTNGQYFYVGSLECDSSSIEIKYYYSNSLTTSYIEKQATIQAGFDYMDEFTLKIYYIREVNGYVYIALADGFYLFTQDITDTSSWKLNNVNHTISSGTLSDPLVGTYFLNYHDWPRIITYKNGYYGALFAVQYTGDTKGIRLVFNHAQDLNSSWGAVTQKSLSPYDYYNQKYLFSASFEDNSQIVAYSAQRDGSSYYTLRCCLVKDFVHRMIIEVCGTQTQSLNFRGIVEGNNFSVAYHNDSNNSLNNYSYITGTSTASNFTTTTNSSALYDKQAILKLGTHFLVSTTNTSLVESNTYSFSSSTITTYNFSNLASFGTDISKWILTDDGLYSFLVYSNNVLSFKRLNYGIMLPNITITSTNSNVKAYIKGKD